MAMVKSSAKALSATTAMEHSALAEAELPTLALQEGRLRNERTKSPSPKLLCGQAWTRKTTTLDEEERAMFTLLHRERNTLRAWQIS
jgi:hypothetical protein